MGIPDSGHSALVRRVVEESSPLGFLAACPAAFFTDSQMSGGGDYAGSLREAGIIASRDVPFIFCPAVLNRTLRDFGRSLMEAADIPAMCAAFRARFLDEAFAMQPCPELLQAVAAFSRFFPGASDFPLLFSDCGKPSSSIKVNLINIKRLMERLMARRGGRDAGADNGTSDGLPDGSTDGLPEGLAAEPADETASEPDNGTTEGLPGGSADGLPEGMTAEPADETASEPDNGTADGLPEGMTGGSAESRACASHAGIDPDPQPGAWPDRAQADPEESGCLPGVETAFADRKPRRARDRGNDSLSGTPSAYADYARAAPSWNLALPVPDGGAASGHRAATVWLPLETAHWRPDPPEPALAREMAEWDRLPPEEPPYFERTYPATRIEEAEEPLQLCLHIYLMKCADGRVHPLMPEEAAMLADSYAGDLDEEEVRAELREQSRKTLTQEAGGKLPEKGRLMRYLKACLDRRVRRKREDLQAGDRLKKLAGAAQPRRRKAAGEKAGLSARERADLAAAAAGDPAWFAARLPRAAKEEDPAGRDRWIALVKGMSGAALAAREAVSLDQLIALAGPWEKDFAERGATGDQILEAFMRFARNRGDALPGREDVLAYLPAREAVADRFADPEKPSARIEKWRRMKEEI